MECDVFRKNIYKYLNDDIDDKLMKDMQVHMKECEECRQIYQIEADIEKSIADSFDIDDMDFVSSKTKIMESLDINKYSKNNKVIHLKYFINKNIKKIASIAAVFIIAIISFNTIINYLPNNIEVREETKVGKVEQPKQKEEPPVVNNKKNEIKPQPKPEVKKPLPVDNKQISFQKQEGSVEEVEFNTEWKSFNNGTMKASINGRGEEGIEEADGYVSIKDESNGKVFNYKIIDNHYAPLQVEWLDSKNILAIVGYKYGTVNKGGELYLLNTDTAKCALVLERDDMKQITQVKVQGNNIKINELVYEDTNMTKFSEKEISKTLQELRINDIKDVISK